LNTRTIGIASALLALVLLGCQAPPAATPTMAPTQTSQAPTEAPTVAPTSSPTASPTDEPTASPTTEPTASSTVEPTASPQAQFPRTVVDDEGTSVTIESEPQSIVSLTPANTETLFALGAGDRLTGGTDFDDYPPEAAAAPDVVVQVEVLTEQIVDIDPDLILAGGNNFTPPAEIQRLRELGFPVVVTYPETVDEVLADIELVGAAVGADEEAATIVAAMEERIAQVTDAVADLPQPRVFYEIGYLPDIYGPADDSFTADMVSLAGGEPITTGDPVSFVIPLERLVDEDPEIIVLGDAAYGVCPDSVAERPGWDEMTAVANDAIVPVDDIIVTRPAPRLGEGLAALALAIHPDADLAPPTAGTSYCEVPATP